MSEIKKRCAYCHRAYRPDPRTAGFQKSCSAPTCRRKRKQEAQAKFLKENPNYFRGRYGQIKKWLAAHPGYTVSYTHLSRARFWQYIRPIPPRVSLSYSLLYK